MVCFANSIRKEKRRIFHVFPENLNWCGKNDLQTLDYPVRHTFEMHWSSGCQKTMGSPSRMCERTSTNCVEFNDVISVAYTTCVYKYTIVRSLTNYLRQKWTAIKKQLDKLLPQLDEQWCRRKCRVERATTVDECKRFFFFKYFYPVSEEYQRNRSSFVSTLVTV